MKKFLLALVLLFGCAESSVTSPYQMKCEKVVHRLDRYDIQVYRCANTEMVCYITKYDEGITCRAITPTEPEKPAEDFKPNPF